MMDNNIESAIKRIFLECIKEPQIIDSLKNELSGNDRTCESAASSRNSSGTIEHKGYDNSIEKRDLLQMNHKLDKIIGLLENGENQGNSLPVPSFLGIRKSQNDDLVSLKADNKRLEVQVQKMGDALGIEKTEKEALEKEKQDILDRYQVAEEALKVWENLNLLSDDSKEYIYQLCGSGEFYAIVSLGRDVAKIEQLWSYLREQAVKRNTNDDDVRILNNFFEFCIKVANSTRINRARYCFYEPMMNDGYDVEHCIKTSDSRQIGNIKEIIVRGVKKEEKVIFKSIVRIE